MAVVTASLVPAVLPRTPGSAATAGRHSLRLGPLPLPVLGPDGTRLADTVYALTAVDRSGRIGARGILAELGWLPGTRLAVSERAGVITLRVAGEGRSRVDRRGYLILALTVRRWCRLATGDQLLLVADRRTAVVTGYPLPVLDRLLDAASAAGHGGAQK
ncbi:hypothetical protein SAMN05421684_7832 [Asanoa ishikariensis]|uniref:Uncharacterized protein n=1 Tax=Asanoa ishikariensis TaxID=137265 RepID=A0A1H3UQR6_9ACTN|nr:hypothetical protein SAMN05421684_7832 [Asanoa ishikariensis]